MLPTEGSSATGEHLPGAGAADLIAGAADFNFSFIFADLPASNDIKVAVHHKGKFRKLIQENPQYSKIIDTVMRNQIFWQYFQ